MNKSPVHVRVSRRYAFPPAKVFNAWIIPQEASKFLFATPTGRVTRVEIDPRAGGKFTIVDERDGEFIEHTGKYLAVEPAKRLAFSFSVPKYGNEVTRVFLEFIPYLGGCELILTHEGVWEEYADKTREGWTGMLEKLDEALRA